MRVPGAECRVPRAVPSALYQALNRVPGTRYRTRYGVPGTGYTSPLVVVRSFRGRPHRPHLTILHRQDGHILAVPGQQPGAAHGA